MAHDNNPLVDSFAQADDNVALNLVNILNKGSNGDAAYVCNSFIFGICVIAKGSTLYAYESAQLENFARLQYDRNESIKHCQGSAPNVDFDSLPKPLMTMQLPSVCLLMEISLSDHSIVICLKEGNDSEKGTLFLCRHIAHIQNSSSIFENTFIQLPHGLCFNPQSSLVCWGRRNHLLVVCKTMTDSSPNTLRCFDYDGKLLAVSKLSESGGGDERRVTSICGCFDNSDNSILYAIGLTDNSVALVEFYPDKGELSISNSGYSDYGVEGENGGDVLGLSFMSKNCIAGIRIESGGFLVLSLIDIEGLSCIWREDEESSTSFFILSLCLCTF